MELYGSNARFGAERVDLTEQRYVIAPSGEGKPFPLGTADLLQVLTQRKDGSWRTTYAFPLSEEDGDPIPAEDEAAEPAKTTAEPEEEASEPAATDEAQAEGEEVAPEGADDDSDEPADAEGEAPVAAEDDVEPAEVAETAAECEGADEPAGEDAAPAADAEGETPDANEDGEVGADEVPAAPKSTYEALCEAVDVVNLYLQQAFDVSHRRFGSVAGVQVEVPPFGSGYTRVEMVPLDAHGEPSPTPLHLHVETGDNPGGPYSFSAMIEYDAEGNPAHVTMNEYGDEYYQCKVNVTVNEKTGRLSVQKIEETVGPNRERHLVYKRAWTPRDGGGRGYRRDDGNGWGGRDDRRGPRDYDRRDDCRGGRYDDRRGFGGRDDRDFDRRGGRYDDRGPRRDYDRGGDFRGGRDDRRSYDRRDDRGFGGRDRYRDDRGPRDFDRRDPSDRGDRKRARYNGRAAGSEYAPTGRRRYDDSEFAGPRKQYDHYETHYGSSKPADDKRADAGSEQQ